MLHLHDIALLSGRMTDDQWNQVARPGGHPRSPWWALPPLMLTARYYPAAVPARVLDTLTAGCPSRLRRLAQCRTLSEDSLSYLWLEAFPGLEWAPSVGEMLEYVTKRIVKAADLLRARKRTGAAAPGPDSGVAQQPGSKSYILRWLVSRPPRPETMSAVRAALTRS